MDDVNIIVPIGHDDGVRIAEALEAMASRADGSSEVTSLDGTSFAVNSVDAVGIPTYVSDVTEYSRYGLTETGWYVFARIKSGRSGVTVTDDTTVEGAAGYIAEVGTDHIDVAVRFDVAATSQVVVVGWGTYAEVFVFKATDLAVRNLDYRVTFFVYDLAPYATWEWAPASDATFVEGKDYWRASGDGYAVVPVTEYTAGDPLPAWYEQLVSYELTADEAYLEGKSYYRKSGATYAAVEVVAGTPVPEVWYVHSKVTFAGMTKNVTYRLDAPVDCPSEFVLPEVEDDDHGCWYEMRFIHTGSYSSTLTPPTPDVKVATQHTQAEKKGLNMVDLHYSNVAGAKVWRFLNTHSDFNADVSPLVSIAFRTPPIKIEYVAGEALETAGAVVVATYEDGHTKIVTPTYTPANGVALTTETTELVASFTVGEVTATASTPITVTGGE